MEKQIKPSGYAGTPASPGAGVADGFTARQPVIVRPRFPFQAGFLSQWEELAARTQAAPFLHPGWMQAWWDAFGSGDLEVCALRQDGRLAALLCLSRRQGQLEAAANSHSPQFGILAESEAATTALAAEVFAGAPAQVSLGALDPGGATLRACNRMAERAGYRVVTRPQPGTPYAQLPATWEEIEGGLARSVRRHLKAVREQLEELGELKTDVITGGADLSKRVNEAFVVEVAGWKGHKGTAVLCQPHTQRFYIALAQWAASRGMLRLYLLRSQDQVIAMCFTLQHHGVCYLLKGGYDPGLERYSPGTLVIEALLRDCVERGLRRVEFCGEDEPFKHVWTSGFRDCVQLEAFAPTVAGQLAWAGFTYSRPLTNRLRQALGWPQAGHRP